MTFSGIKKHFGKPRKYPALKRTIEITTMALKADWNWSSSEHPLYFCSVIPIMSSIHTTIGIPKDLQYIATASVIVW